jgi:hypothetical protein
MTSFQTHGFSLPPPCVLLFELLASSAVVGVTRSDSRIRPATFPILSTCAYSIIQNGSQHMRPRWASLLGGFSVAVLLQYLDLGIISRWNFSDRGPAGSQDEPPNVEDSTPLRSYPTTFQKVLFGWNAMWSFRHVNSPYEVKNVPPFSAVGSKYIPTKRAFVLKHSTVACICYLLLDLLGARKPPANAAQIFSPDLVPVFSRLGSITTAEIKTRALTITGFALTFYCVIQGFQSLAAAIAVGLGLSKVENWRPAFGSLSDAYSLKNVWG